MSDPSVGSDDEALSALLDGALDAAQEASLRSRLAHEPELAARFATLADANRRVQRAYAAVAAEPVPERVRALLHEGRSDRDVIELSQHRERRRLSPLATARLSTALAAGIALATGVAIGLSVGSRPPASGAGSGLAAVGDVAPADPLFAALETAPSGIARDLGHGVSAEPRLTFRSRDGGYCRRVDLARETDAAVVLACRRAGGWRVETASFARAARPGTEFRPATEAASAVEAAIDASIDGEPLSGDAERALLANGWPARP